MRVKSDKDIELERDLKTLRMGITAEALEVLERRYGFNLPIFSNDAMYSAESNDKFLRQALIKEGQRQIISFIRLATNQDNNG